MSEAPKPYRPRCANLCCRAMQVYGEDFEKDPSYQAGMTEFWCLRTFKGYGPDDRELSLELCSDPQRSCFREY